MSTSLSELPVAQPQQMSHPDVAAQQNYDINSMIDSVAQEVNANHGQQEGPNMSASALSYQMDQSQIPQHGPNPHMEEHEMMGMNPYAMMPTMEPEPELSLTQKITNEAKLPLVAMALFMMLNLSQINVMLTSFVPRLLAENGEINMMGLFCKAVLFAALLFAAKYFL